MIKVLWMKKEQFEAFPDDQLFDSCFAPLLKAYKVMLMDETVEGSVSVKERFYNELTKGQRALFTFRAYYNHAIVSPVEYYWWSCYFIAQPKIWLAIKAGLREYGDARLLELAEQTQQLLETHHHLKSLQDFQVTREDVEVNQELKASISYMYNAFMEAVPYTIEKINAAIRSNYQEYIEIDEELNIPVK